MRRSAFSERIDKIYGIMEEQGIGSFIITPSSDMKYTCGYSIKGDERLLCLVLSPGHEPFILANALYELQVRETPVEDFVFWSDGGDPISMLKAEMSGRGIFNDRGSGKSSAKIAVDAAMPARFLVGIANAFEGASIINGSPLLDPLRVFKDEEELQAMREAAVLGEEALKAAIEKGEYWIGRKETDFLADFIKELTCRGISDAGGIVAAGENAAVPHHHSGSSTIEWGKCLLIDFAGTWKNYNTDMTRTYFFGEPDEHFKEVYRIVLEANLAGEKAAVAGNTLGDVDAAAREVIESYGYGKYFTHRTGHGIGIDCHEGPSAGKGEKTLIRPGMVFSCEPGIYLPGRFGIRIEDLCMINADGSTSILQKLPKELTCINRN